MTQKLVEMAAWAGLRSQEGISEFAYLDRLEFLEAMIRADEREQCAKVCDRVVEGKDPDDIHSDSQRAALSLDAEIRARWNK